MGGCLPVAQMSAAGLFSGDVLVHDGLQGAVSLQLFQNGVDSVLQRRVLCHADGVVFLGVAGIQDLQAGVGSNELLGGSVVDDNGIHLTVVQSLHSGQTVIVSHDVFIAEIIGAVDVAGGAALGADLLACQIIRGSNVGAFGNDDGLDAR